MSTSNLSSSNRLSLEETSWVTQFLETYGQENVIYNLTMGTPFWSPPTSVQQAIIQSCGLTETYRYGATCGLSQLEKEIGKLLDLKFASSCGNEVMICSGSNQGFLNILLCLCSPGDEVILFRPYYFSHYTACLLAGVKPVVVDTDSEFLPQPQGLRISVNTKLVVVVSPGNPSGRVISTDLLRSLYQLCFQRGVWLVIDEAYEHFTFDGMENSCFSATDGVINLYTFSKSYSLAGLRVGYFCYPNYLRKSMLEIQDTIATHACHLAQHAALAALRDSSKECIQNQVQEMVPRREIFWQVVSKYNTYRANGGFFFFVPIPKSISSYDAVSYLIHKYGILVFPGQLFGMPNYLRISYGSLSLHETKEAANQLNKALATLWDNR
ncbi:aspartate transaminase [Galdieria sulphuraria]|uniref:Aspartate transaminase n=1 Tax=Galdieria sulphuraria TaxID=130081 RepID=M2Y6G0_GALSU|nr:aspartate transaminase [Galdieria sulphuraria]EME31434.1 aspartate transaminase [Galdieria sulphuraria]|eukprot:XP_005707954.1 aspartate transaminase [Galdieria sulphuraria]